MEPVAPPTIAFLTAQGIAAATVWYEACKRSAWVPFAAMGLPPDTPFPAIARRRRFRCSACGSREVTLQPCLAAKPARGAGRTHP